MDPEQESLSQESPDQVQYTILDVIRVVFTNFAGFAVSHLARGTAPALYLVIWLIGMDATAGWLELEELIYGQYQTTNWFHAWIRIMGGGLAAGPIRYWIVGSLFHLGVRFSGGEGPARSSRYVFIYAALPVAIVDLVVKIVQMLVFQNQYFAGQIDPAVTGVVSMVMLIAFIFSIRICFQGAVAALGADRKRLMVVFATVLFLLTAAMFSMTP